MCVYVCQLGDGGVEPVSGDLRWGSSGEESGVYVSRLGGIATGWGFPVCFLRTQTAQPTEL